MSRRVLIALAFVLSSCRLVEDEPAPPTPDAEAVTMSATARTHLAAGRWAQAVELLEGAAARHVEAGTHGRAVQDLHAAVYASLYHLHRLDRAQAFLDRAEPLLEHDAPSWAMQPYYASLVALESGDPLRAEKLIERSRVRVEAEAPEQLGALQDTRAYVLQILGRADEAHAIRERLAATAPAGTCSRAKQLNMSAWGSLLHADDLGEPAPADAGRWLDEARRIYEASDCPAYDSPDLLAVHYAYYELLRERPEAARRWLDRAPASSASPSERMWKMIIDARIATAGGDAARALTIADAVVELARSVLDVEAERRAELVRADAFARMERPDDHRRALERAEALLFDAMLVVPIGEGRDRFLAERSRGSRALVEFALARGDTDGALCALRRARGRVLYRAAQALALEELAPDDRARWQASVQEVRRLHARIDEEAQANWDLPADELGAFRDAQRARRERAKAILTRALVDVERIASAPTCADLRGAAPDEVLLGYFEVGDRLVGFASTATTTRVHHFAARPARSDGWLNPFASALGSAERITVLAGGPTAEVPFHRARFGGGRLGTERAFAYTLDLPSRPADDRFEGRALVVSDGAANLGGARKEGADVARALHDTGWSVEHLTKAAATASRTRAELRRAQLFHYAGHLESTERSRWSDRMMLWGGSIEAREIVTLARVPRWVVLTGCETAAVRPDAAGGVMSLAHAFLLAGADQVVASTAPLDDEAARRVGTALIAATKRGTVDLVAALRVAMSEAPEAIREVAAPVAVFTR